MTIDLHAKTTLKFIILYASCFIASCSYGFIYVLNLLVTQLGGDTLNVGLLLSCAGVVTIPLVGFSGYLARRFSPSYVCALGMLFNFIGFLILHQIHHINLLFYSAGLFIGAGWSLYYATSPMIINKFVSDRDRGKHLSMMAAFVVLGTGIGPILSHIFITLNIPIITLYTIPIILSSIAGLTFILQASLWQEPGQVDNKLAIYPTKVKKLGSVRQILTSEAKYPLIMVFLGACMLTSMMNFQTLYAEAHHLNFSIYYVCYMSSVISSRFLFGSILTKKNPLLATPYLLLLMIASLILMIINTDNQIYYVLCAVGLGISYGLVYPLIKTYAVNVSHQDYRHDVLAYFTLSYFIGVYGFPLIAGFIIKHYGYAFLLSFLIIIVAIDFYIGLSRSKKYNLIDSSKGELCKITS